MNLSDASVLDPQWIEFRKAFEQNKPDTIPEDFMVAQHAWRVLDYLQKAQALAAVRARDARGMVIWCSPVTFLRSEYKRPIAQPKKPSSNWTMNHGDILR